MKLPLDENLPKRLKSDFPEYEVFTIQNMGWRGKDNGELVKLILEKKLDALITFDKNLEHQQNFRRYKVAVSGTCN